MFRYTVNFLVIVLIAGFLGFWALEGMAMQAARILFVVFAVLFAISFLSGRRLLLK